MNAADGFAFRISQICYIDYIERVAKKYVILLKFVKRDILVLLIISCPFQKSLENLFLVKVRCLEFEKYGLCAFYKQLLLFHYSYMDLFIYLFMLYLFCGNKVELQWGNITGFVSSGPFTRPAMKYPSYIHEYLHDYLSFSKYLQIPPNTSQQVEFSHISFRYS